jgi:ATP-binding cassette, subfamily B, bacterial
MHVRETLRVYARASWRHRADAILSCCAPLSNVLFTVLMPFFTSRILASLITRGPALKTNLVFFVSSAALGLGLNFLGIRRCMALRAKVMRDLNDLVFARLLERSTGFFSNQVGGKLVSDALDFVTSYGTLMNDGFINGSGFLLSTILGLVLVVISSWVIGIAILLLLAGLMCWTIIEQKRRSDIREKRQIVTKQLTSHVSDSIANAVTIKTFAAESREISTNRRLSHTLADIRIIGWQRTVTSETERMGVLLFMQVALITLVILLTAHNPHLLAASIYAFTYTLTLVNRFATINALSRQVEESLLQASPMAELLEQPNEIIDSPDAKPLVVTHGEITCTHVSFRYADTGNDDNVFTNLSLHIQAGEKIGLVGYSGGGKSTLTRLLLRFDDISAGSIRIDGHDIREVTQTSLRRQISYVPQEPLLFHRTIRENIAYGNPEVTQKQIEEAARLAYAHEFIAKLPQGYNTTVGERGIKLSGGQRQRVAIARAILMDAPILVLDEATSALDSESEKAIQKALQKLMRGRTTVVIAHRLSTIQKMDRILVLNNGGIIEDGTHNELLAAKGIYTKLWAHQSGGFIKE